MNGTTACCGFDCSGCPMYSGTPTEICCGCRSDGLRLDYCDDGCEIRRCVMARGLDTCGGCALTDTCPTLAELLRSNPKAKERLMKKHK